MNIVMDQNFNVQVLLNEAVVTTGKVTSTGGDAVSEVPGDAMGAGPSVKDPLMSSWPFVIGITTATLAVSILLGLLLAKRKIKKGYELYED
ncbi:hypothetical protein QA584_23925 [Anaerocolumna sp. AGMB13025]|uniref:hypothetical protein n=1 Tax=Anaerocolumna sp. AGMB13025 TaxID=3039116 RepID=UPI00242018E8|nr:hypothetical protein [Anaerocolumna sp. AGMB13025]WFR56629.1 hypothetical protein QA584_23925 [Anaerocolumna sp. AGMB13025]